MQFHTFALAVLYAKMCSMGMNTNTKERTGAFHSFVNWVGGGYLVGMLLYFALRLILGDGLWWLALLNTFTIYTFAPLLVLLPLTGLLGLWRLAVRLLLLALLAVLWFGPFFQPPNVQPASRPVLRVLTYNIWANNNQRLHLDEGWMLTSGADVIVIQELPRTYHENDGIDSLRDLYPHQVRGHLLTLSRYPIIEATTVLDRQQRVVLDIEGQQVAVYNVHFDWPLGNPSRFDLPVLRLFSRYDQTSRNAQIEELLALIREETLPYVVAGDFNMSQHSLIYADITLLMDDSYRETQAGLGHTWPAGDTWIYDRLLRLDYVWYGNGMRAVDTQVGPALGSDHLPMIAFLEMPFE